MMKHALLVCLVLGVAAAASGCCGWYSGPCQPFGSHIAICDPTHCGEAPFGPACGPVCDEPCGPMCDEPCGPECGPACDSCGDVCGEPCGDPCGDPCGECGGPYGRHGYGSRGHPWGPLSWLFGIFTYGYRDSGCGEFYWSDFHSEPPDCHDPCDRCGNYTGGYDGGGYRQSSGCPQCGSGYGPVGYARNVNRDVRPRAAKAGEGYAIRDPSSKYAPKIVSVTDRAVGPTAAKAATVQQVSHQRQRAPAQQ